MSMLQIWLQLLAPRFGERAFSPSASAVHPHIRGHSKTPGDLCGLCSLHGYFLSCQVSLYSFQLVITYCSASQPASQLRASKFVRPSVGLSRLRSPVRQSVCQRTHRALSPSRPLGVAGGLAKRGSRPTREETDLELELGARRSERGRRWAKGNKAAEGAGTEGGWRGPQ